MDYRAIFIYDKMDSECIVIKLRTRNKGDTNGIKI